MQPDQPSEFTPEELYACAACALLVTRADGTILTANDMFCRWLGYPLAAIAGSKLQDFLSVGARIFHQTHWLPLMQLQGSVSEVKLDFKRADGTKMPMLVNARTLESDGRQYHSVAAFISTDRDRYEKELVKAKAEAVELLVQRTHLQQEAVDRGRFAEQMIGIVSHDLRNPLTAIRMGAEMIALDDDDPRRLKLSGRINQSVDRAMKLVSELLDFTLTRTGKPLAIDRSRIHFHGAVTGAIDELRLVFPRIALVHIKKGAGYADADRERLVQVIGNLVANAERYGDGLGVITVTSSVLSGIASVAVHNWGNQIPESVLPTLFQAMARGAHEQDVGGGVGLGLYIVSEIAKGHGGHAFAQSTQETGTRIGVEFPAKKAPSIPQAHTRKRQNEVDEAPGAGS
jgi:phosphoserine phosphatase RsbU/P